ncbi:hypothetical protein H4219_006156, partial [Mycoemilia scoparia]
GTDQLLQIQNETGKSWVKWKWGLDKSMTVDRRFQYGRGEQDEMEFWDADWIGLMYEQSPGCLASCKSQE